MNPVVIILVSALLVAALLWLGYYYRHKRSLKKKVVEERLTKMLFPGERGEQKMMEMLEHVSQITGGRFTEEQILDYYLKIKGLQIFDINSISDREICDFLMQPTVIRLRYKELVCFYEKYLNQPTAVGQSAVD